MVDNEIVDILNEQHEVVRQALKTEAHEYGLLHKTVIGYLRYGDEWALVRQAADKQDADQLVAAVGGHVSAGESDIDALLRESEEEIGTRNIAYKYIGSAIYQREVIGRNENHLFVVYEIATEDSITLNHESVAIERFTPSDLKDVILKTPDRIGAAFFFNLRNFYPSYLPATDPDSKS